MENDERMYPLRSGLDGMAGAGLRKRIEALAWTMVEEALPPAKDAPPAQADQRREVGIGEEVTSPAQVAQPAADTRRSADEDSNAQRGRGPLPSVV